MKRVLACGCPWAAALVLVARLAVADPLADAPPAEGQALGEAQSEEADADLAEPAPRIEPALPVEPALPTEPHSAAAPEQAVEPAPPEPPQAEPVAPPPPAPELAPVPAAPRRGPFGLSASATRTLGWVTVAVSTAASIGLTTAGIAVCQGQGPGCIQGQPLIWSGAAVGLAGIPIGFTLIVRGKQLSLEGPLASKPLAIASSQGRQF